MSTGLPYLNKLRKGELAELAELTDLQDYDEYTKPDLAVKLDEHLQSNASIFGKESQLEEYYRRASQSSRGSPVKRGSRASRESPRDVTPVKQEVAAPTPRSTRRRTKVEEVEPTDESDVPAETPARAIADVAVQLPASPRLVTDVIEHQTTAWRKSISEAWNNSGVQEQSDSLRATLSSVQAVEVIVTLLEGLSLIREVLPLRYLATIPAIDAVHTPSIPVKIPDLFVLVDSSFWAPVSLWLLTSVFLPLTVAYFFNISLSVAQSSGGPAAHTRRNSRVIAQTHFDPLSFNISKAIITYLVYAHGFTFWSVYSSYSIQTVNASIPFQYAGILTGTAIGTVGTLYEAILRK
ncbi:hypothetical protein BJY04DRAFT_140754 [Aspergillus karnatakaensis]|uniref:uncharacterized protein n=1 Tax=Aspergillus karnatakaensis TaxID=1810916 RepID=UPI003CCE40C2